MNDEINQTQFSQESPLFTPEADVSHPEAPVIPPPPWFKQPKFLVLGLGGILLLLIVSLLFLRPVRRNMTVFEPGETPQSEREVGPEQAKINALRTELEAADPATQELPFPAVNMELNIPDDRDLR